MKIFSVFKKRQNNGGEVVLLASATRYPDRIMVDTVDRVDAGFGISSTTITFLPAAAHVAVVAAALRQHLLLSRSGLPIPTDYKVHYAQFLAAAGFKSSRDYHRAALHLMVSQSEGKITLSATRNDGHGFEGIKDATVVLDAGVDDLTLGNAVIAAWERCG